MHYIFNIHHQTRHNMLRLLEHVDNEQLLIIPRGHRNNLLWNAGHVVVIQQMICYQAARLPMHIDDTFIKNFRKGSSPADWKTVPSREKVINILKSTTEHFQKDYQSGLFNAIPPFTTPYKMPFGILVRTVEDAIRFNNTHEAMHLGIMSLMKKCVQ